MVTSLIIAAVICFICAGWAQIPPNTKEERNRGVNWLIFGIIFTLFAGVTPHILSEEAKNQRHACIDATHKTCDSLCTCDGMDCGTHYHNGKECQYEGLECPELSKALATVPARDYQLEIIVDSILVFEGTRFVGKLPLYSNNSLDSLLRADNDDE